MPIFVDTNVLVYSRDSSAGTRRERANSWLEHLWRTRDGRLSTQVLHEYYVVVTRKLHPGLPSADAREDVRALQAWRPLALDVALIDMAWRVEDRFGLSFWDALIVGAARTAGCDRLLTEDLQDGQDFGGVIVVNPFTNDPAESGSPG